MFFNRVSRNKIGFLLSNKNSMPWHFVQSSVKVEVAAAARRKIYVQ